MLPRRLLCLSLLLASSLVLAEKPEESDIKRWMSTDAEKMPPPVEESFDMPDLASLKEWRIYDAGKQMGTNRIEIAVDSISIGKEDRIMRYSIAVVAKTGLRNVFFEGLDCFSSRYRNYAWGNPDLTWRKTDTVIWRIPHDSVRNTWQFAMIDDFCGDAGPYSLKTIVNSLKDGKLPPRERAENQK